MDFMFALFLCKQNPLAPEALQFVRNESHQKRILYLSVILYPACLPDLRAGLLALQAIQVAQGRRPPSIPYPDLQNLVRGPVLSPPRSFASTLLIGLPRRERILLFSKTDSLI
jgi:hypothetical protein